MEKRNSGKLVLILILVILVLLAIVLYALWLKPAINGYVVNKQMETRDIVLNSILLQVQQQGFVKIVDQEGNSMVLAPVQQQEGIA